MKIYLDACAIQRPLDNLERTRIRLEAEAILDILLLIEKGQFLLVSSDVLLLEIEPIGTYLRKRHCLAVLKMAQQSVTINAESKALAKDYEAYGVKPFDALHLASAVVSQCDYLCTCDDRFWRSANRIANLPLRVVTPLQLIDEV